MNTTSQIVNLGSVEKIPSGQGRCYIVEGEEIAVFRQRDGRLFAIQNRCPHRQGPLSEGVCGAGKIICPLHSHKFDLATGHGAEPGECIKVYRVTESNGEVILHEQGSGC
jgi:nitrite reductase (NADH) small subunit